MQTARAPLPRSGRRIRDSQALGERTPSRRSGNSRTSNAHTSPFSAASPPCRRINGITSLIIIQRHFRVQFPGLTGYFTDHHTSRSPGCICIEFLRSLSKPEVPQVIVPTLPVTWVPVPSVAPTTTSLYHDGRSSRLSDLPFHAGLLVPLRCVCPVRPGPRVALKSDCVIYVCVGVCVGWL